MHSSQSDYQGIVDLLNALQLPLQIVTQAPSIKPDSNQVRFSTTIGTLKYSRLTSGSILLTDWQNSHAYISQETHQLHLWNSQNSANQRQIWHELARYAVAAYLCDLGYTPIHAAAVVDPKSRAWLIAGQTHAGKSTLVVGLLESGFSYLSDDGLILHPTQQGIIAHAWWGSSLLDPIVSETYPHLKPYLGQKVRERHLIDIKSIYAHLWQPKAVPNYLLFPCFDSTVETAYLEPLSPGIAMAELMRNTAPWLLETPTSHLKCLQSLCSQTQYFQLHLGERLRTHPHQLATVLEEFTAVADRTGADS